MLKHVGKHNNRKVVVLYREVPGEDHMCLLVNSDLLPRLIHDEIMKTLESPSGQAAESFADALFRNVMADGRNTLEALHREQFIQKVPTNQVIMTPTTNSTVRLDELNSILNEMKQGEEAIKRLAELDASAGMTGKRRPPADVREVGVPRDSRGQPAPIPVSNPLTESSADGILTDSMLAQQRLDQAERMKSSAQQLLAEAERLMSEAQELNPQLKTKTKNAKKKSVEAH